MKSANSAASTHVVPPARSAPAKVSASIYHSAGWANTGVNVRSAADGAVIAQLAPGQEVRCGPSTQGWTPVKFGNVTGWVSSQYLDGTAPASPAAASAPADKAGSGSEDESAHQQCVDAINSGDTSQARANGWTISCVPYISSDGSDAAGTGQMVSGMTYPSRKQILICDCAGRYQSFQSVVTYEAGHARGTQLSQAAINWLVAELGTPWYISGPNFKSSAAERWAATVSVCAGNPTADASRYAFSCSILAQAESM